MQQPHTRQSIRILLVEDNPGDVRLVHEALATKNGTEFELLHVDRLKTALDRLKSERIDVVLLDLSLPDETGMETLLRMLRDAPGVPVVVLTGLNDVERAVQEIHHGAQDYLIKGQIEGPLLERSVRYSIERTETLQALRESEERYALAVRGASDGVWDWNLKSKRLYLSPRWKIMLGYTENEISDSPSEWFDRLHPDDSARLQSLIVEHIEGRTPHLQDEHRMRHKDGSYRWMLVRGLAVFDSTGKAARMAGSQTDITSRKELDRLKDEFVSTVSHELRTPLTSIHGSLKLLTSCAAVGELPSQAVAMIDIACKNSERLMKLINDLLDVQKIEAGKFDVQMAPRMKPMDLMPLVEHAVQINAPFAEQFGVRITLNGGVDGVKIKADPERLTQVLTNLLSNAVKFSLASGTVEVFTRRVDNEWIRVSVTDHGPGIPEAFRCRVFEKFAQADASASRQKGGTGLGLSIAKAIVESIGGRIGFTTEPSVATTFYFDLPGHTEGTAE